jgi:DNA-binding LytR/AlgR family response regulator
MQSNFIACFTPKLTCMEVCKILVVEDESLVAMDMVDMLTRMGYELLPAAMGFTDAVNILENHKPDLVLVDINLSGLKTGIDLAQLLRDRYKIPFIFITSHSDKQTVSSASATLPSGYLIKPFDAEDLFTSIEVALANHAAKAGKTGNAEAGLKVDDSIFVKTDRNFTKVKIADILWLESEHNYMFIVTEKGKYIVRSSFKDFLENIPNNRFMQVHKSYIVNITKVESFSHTDLVINSKEIPLSRNFKDEFFAKINRVV